MSVRILALVGSLRADSYNRQLAEAAVKHAPDGIDVEIFEGLAEVPFYNEDLDEPSDVPGPAQNLRDAVARADALLVITPEYNGTIPAVLKNAIDWTSRPYGIGAITAKPAAVVGTAGGRYGGAWAHEDTRKAARVAGAQVLDTSPCPCRWQASASPPPTRQMTTKSPLPCPSFWSSWPRAQQPSASPGGCLVATSPRMARSPRLK